MVYSTDTTQENDSKVGISTDEKDRVWEHPWTTDEIRKNSGHWTLAGDVGLLNHLQEFSHKLISRTHEMEKVVHSVIHKSKEVSAKVNNVINDFQMLSNLQFVENRVYDEEAREPEPSPIPETPPKSKEQREAEMVPRAIKALELGMAVLDRAFEKIEVEETSDSEEDEDVSQGRTILEAKDFYEHRPLPFVIGTQEFRNDDYAGLHSVVEDELSPETTQEDNITESEESEESEEEEEAEELPTKPPPPFIVADRKSTVISTDTLSNNISDSEGSDLFDGGEQENGYVSNSPVEEKAKPVSATTNGLMEELMRRTKGIPPDENKPETIQSPVSKKVPQKKNDDDLFSAGGDSFFHNEDEEDDSPFRKKTGLFSGDNIFGTENDGKSDDDDDLFGKKERPSPVEKAPAPITKVQVLPKLPVKNVPEQKPPTKKSGVPSPQRAASPALFGENEDDDSEDLFGSLSTHSSASSRPASKASPVASSVVNETKKTERGSASPTVASKAQTNTFSTPKETGASDFLFGDDSNGDDLFIATKKTTQKSPNLQVPASISSGSDEDDLFSSKPATKAKRETKNFNEKDSTSKTEKPAKDPHLSLFEESDSFDLFNPVNVQKPKNEQEKVPPPKQKATDPFPSEKKSSLLFEESDSFDLFTPPVETKPKADVIVDKKKEEKPVVSKEIISVPKSENISPVHIDKVSPLVSESGRGNAVSADFDTPLDTSNTLSAINKSRAKIQVKRKKPTRKGRQAMVASQPEPVPAEEIMPREAHVRDVKDSPSLDVFGASESSSITDDVFESTKPQSTHKQKEKDKKNLMSQLMFEAASSKIGKRPSLDILNQEDDDEDDLFSSKNTGRKKLIGSDFSFLSPASPDHSEVLVKASSDIEGPKSEASNAVVSDVSSDDDDLFAAPSFREFRNSISEKNSIFGEDDDIFKDVKRRDSSDVLGETGDGEDDDIFAGVDKEKYEMFPTQVFDDDDDDDIFSNLQKPSKDDSTKTKSQEKNKVEKTKDIFDDPLGGLSMND